MSYSLSFGDSDFGHNNDVKGCLFYNFILRTDTFELRCWRRVLRVPWTARRSNQSILKEMFIGRTGCSWMFIGRTDVEAETPILWPPDVKNWLPGKDPDA